MLGAFFLFWPACGEVNVIDAELSASSLFGTWLTFFFFAVLCLNDAFRLALPVVVLGKDWMPGVVDDWLVLPFFPMVEERV
jgi:hypothetical protein